mmetsp:Transcript_117062/g.342892  ORF Transcript_117062/g.342892 Transcript_117062/m.342892 type:complete len:111 (-) Transcript_117062:93-425(-)
MTVSGTIVSGGKRVKITIQPDGTTEEHEDTVGGDASCSSVYTSDGDSTSIEIHGHPRDVILDIVQNNVPLSWLITPVLSAILAVLCNPLFCCAACGYCCCIRSPSKVHTQ